MVSSVDGHSGSLAALEAWVDGSVAALVREMDCFSCHQALRVRHEPTAILGKEPLNGLPNHPPTAPKSPQRRRKPDAGSRRRTPSQNGSANGSGRLLGYRCQTVARPVTDTPVMTDPQAEAQVGSRPGTQQRTAPCRQPTRPPCQQTFGNPFDNPVTPATTRHDNEPKGCRP